jgi:hypothetical protein
MSGHGFSPCAVVLLGARAVTGRLDEPCRRLAAQQLLDTVVRAGASRHVVATTAVALARYCSDAVDTKALPGSAILREMEELRQAVAP